MRARRLTEDEGRGLQQIVRRGKHESIRVRRAMIITASASGTQVPAIARLVQAAHETTARRISGRFPPDLRAHLAGKGVLLAFFGRVSCSAARQSSYT